MKLKKQESNCQALCLFHRYKFYELSMVLGSSTVSEAIDATTCLQQDACSRAFFEW